MHVILAQEVLLSNEKSYNLPGYEVYHCNCKAQKKRCRGIATFIRRGLAARVENVATKTGTDAQKIALWWNGKRYDLYNWYQPPSDKKVSLDIGEAVHRYNRTIIAGDANAHHTAFGYENNDACGQWIMDVTTSTNLTCLITDRSEPTFLHSKGGLYRPDTALVSSDILDFVKREVLEDVGSDHLPALITVEIFSRQREKVTASWNFKKANWKAYASTLDTRLREVNIDDMSIEKANDVLVSEIMHAARKSIPRGVRKKYTPGWTKELERAVAKRQEARKDFIRNPTATNRKRYNAYYRRAKKIGEANRAAEWKSTCEGFNFKTSSREAWSLVRKLEGKRASHGVEPLEVNGKTLLSARAEAEAFTRHYTRVGGSNSQASKRMIEKVRKEWEKRPSVANRLFQTEFTKAELEGALRKSKHGKAPGRDGVTQEMLLHMGPRARTLMLRLFNRTWESGTTPTAWRTAVVVPILKKGKKASDPASYRPISLVSTISKTMERMVNGRLYYYMEDGNMLDENQAGFRRHRSTVDQLVLFTQSVINAWQHNEHTVAVFVDLKNAYDKVWRAGLLLKLQRYGINGRMYNWLKGFLSNRYIRTRVNGVYSKTRPLKEGLPQGSALSCTLFLCFLNDLSEAIPSFDRLSFADDISAWQSDQNVDRAAEALNRDLCELKRYCDRWCMQINTTKTVYNIYSNSREVLARDLEVKIENKCLQRDHLPRYLGVSLDSRLNLTAHVEQLANGVRERVGLMRKLAGTNWGAALESLKILYVTFVRSALEYASPILNLASKKSLEKLTRVQNAAMRLMTGGLRSTPIAALEVATGCEPLHLRREVQTLVTRERFLRLGESNPLKVLTESFGATRRRLKKVSVLSAAEAAEREYDLPTDRAPLETPGWPPDLAPQPLEVCLDIGLKGKKSDFAPEVLKATALECIDAYPKDHAKCYIDGSATEGVSDGGYGVYIEWNDNSTTSVSGPVGKRTCSFECEKAALTECVRLLKERQSKDDQFPGAVIFCDCRSLVQNLGGFNPSNMGKILNVTEQLRQSGARITCQWIPSHVGIHGNELADELANGGRLKPQPVVPATLSHVASLLRGRTVKRWEETIRSCDDTRLVKLYEARRAGDYSTHLARGDAVQVFRMRVNHTMLLANLSKRGWSPTASCRLCDYRVEDALHVLFDCPALKDIRSPGWGCRDRNEVLWSGRDVLMEAAKLVKVFLRRTNE